jgi:sugar/nucleoside kinase (ribokinase family)
MKIAIIGTINKDLILPYERAPIQSLGGITYSTLALANLVKQNVSIIPVSYIGEDIVQAANHLFGKYPIIDKSNLIQLPQKNHKVILEYSSPVDRTEKALLNFPPLEWKQIKLVKKCDFIIVNMITGWDIPLNAYLKLSKKAYKKMYLDVHYLVMGIDKMGNRFPKCPSEIREWLKGARFIQMNEKEFNIIAENSLHEISFFEKYLNKDQILIITLGEKGARLVFYKDNNIRDKHFPTVRLEEIYDATGCGDVFGAAFVSKYLQTEDAYESIEFANLVSSANCLIGGTMDMDRLPEIMEKFKA